MASLSRRKFVHLTGTGVVFIAGCSSGTSSGTPADSARTFNGAQPPGDDGTIIPPEDIATETLDPREDGSSSDGEETPTAANDQKEVIVGEIVHGNQLSMVVQGVNRVTTLNEDRYIENENRSQAATDGFLGSDDDDDRRLHAKNGTEFATVELAIKNTTGRFLPLDEFQQPQLRDGRTTYSPAFPRTTRSLTDGRLGPGEVERADLAFVVPKGAERLTLTVGFGPSERPGVERVVVDLDRASNRRVDLEQELQVPVHSFGQAAEVRGVKIMTTELQLGNNLGPFLQPENGHEYVILGVVITNTTGEALLLSPPNQMRLKDGTGRHYREEGDALQLFDQFEDGVTVADGEDLEGKLAYQVERGTAPLYWSFDFSAWNDGEKAYWQLR